MDFSTLCATRQSDRKYKPDAVPEELILKCIEAARLAPSACNSQPWTFIVIDEPELKEKVAAETYDWVVNINKWTHQAPVLIAIVVEKAKLSSQIGGRIKNKEYVLIDIGIAAEHFCLQATELGLGTCMIGWFNEKKIMKLLNIPDNRSIGLLIALGYSAEPRIREKKRKEITEIYRKNKYR